jgi:hypothetical protein
MRILPGGICLVLVLSALAERSCYGANELLETLVNRGVQLGPQETVLLPKPALDESMPEDAKQQAITALLGGRYDWEAFARKSVVSPFVLKISENDRQAGNIGRQVDIYFVAYGPLSKLAGDDYLQKQLGIAASDSDSANGERARMLTADELAKRGLVDKQGGDDLRWVAVESTFLGKVRISITTRNVKTVTNDTVVVASTVDPRFDQDAEYPNLWRSISADEAGRRQLGPPQRYSGLASYMKATKLGGADDLLFVEYHVAFAEPEGWFNGTNLLRSKLPIVAQDMVRKFRRNLSGSN